MRTIFIVVMVALLSACGTTNVIRTSDSTYSVSLQHYPFGSWYKEAADTVSRGEEYCADRKQDFVLIKVQKIYSPLSTQVIFNCADKNFASQCKRKMQGHELDPIREKVELIQDPEDAGAVPFAIATNDSFPSNEEKYAIARWATIREECIKQVTAAQTIPAEASPLEVSEIQQERSFGQAASASIGDLIVSLYQQRMTYGEFAKKCYEIRKEAIDSKRRFRLAVQISDQQRQMEARQLALQQQQNNVAAWSAFQQSVNARQPLTIHMNVHCNSQSFGNSVNTSCY